MNMDSETLHQTPQTKPRAKQGRRHQAGFPRDPEPPTRADPSRIDPLTERLEAPGSRRMQRGQRSHLLGKHGQEKVPNRRRARTESSSTPRARGSSAQEQDQAASCPLQRMCTKVTGKGNRQKRNGSLQVGKSESWRSRPPRGRWLQSLRTRPSGVPLEATARHQLLPPVVTVTKHTAAGADEDVEKQSPARCWWGRNSAGATENGLAVPQKGQHGMTI